MFHSRMRRKKCNTFFPKNKMSSSRSIRTPEKLPNKWKDLNTKLHSYYGYSPNLNLHPTYTSHLPQLKAIADEQPPDEKLIRLWIEKIEELVAASKIILESEEESQLQTPKKQKLDNHADESFLPVTPITTPIVLKEKRKRKEMPANTIPIFKKEKEGYGFDIKNIISKNQFPPNIVDANWVITDSRKNMELRNSNGTATQMLLFGKIYRSCMGIYDDFDPSYHTSIHGSGNRWLTMKLSPVNGLVDEFIAQMEGIKALEDKVTDRFSESAPKFRAWKGPQELQLKRRLVNPANSSISIVPLDEPGNVLSKYLYIREKIVD